MIHSAVKFLGAYKLGPYCCVGVEIDEEGLFLEIGPDANIRSHTVLYLGSKMGPGFSTGHHVTVRDHCDIGDHVSIGTGTVIEHHVKIGHHVRIHSNAFIPEFSVLEDDCWIGPKVTFTNAKYPVSRDVKKTLKGPWIGRGAKIGANATLLPGVRIGAYALIGAGSVVTKDVPDYAVVAGNPAKIINHLSQLPYGEKQHEHTTC